MSVSSSRTIVEEKIDALERRVREKLETDSGFADAQTQAMLLERLFKAFDRDGSGCVNRAEFSAALLRLNFVGVQSTVDELFNRYDADGSETLMYAELAKLLFGLQPNPYGDPVARGVVERFRAKVLARGGRNGIRTLGRIFRRMDDNGNGRLDREDLRTGMQDYGITINNKDLDKVIAAFDRDGDGSVNFDEFLRGIRGGMSQRRKRLVRKAFRILDKTGDGVLTIDDLAGSYSVSEHPDVLSGKLTAEEALDEFLDGFEGQEGGVRGDGTVTEGEFMDYYRDVSASITGTGEGTDPDGDDYFELMIRNAWRMSGGGSTACRRVLVHHRDGTQTVEEIKDDIGIGAQDTGKMMENLRRQGFDPVRIELTG
jgi:Ca2+-binding EF-hand superfamily protein